MERMLLDLCQDLMIILDGEGLITFGNQGGAEKFKLNANELRGMQYIDLIHPDDRPQWKVDFCHVRRHPGQKRKNEYRLRKGAGEWWYVEMVMVGQPDASSGTHVLLGIRDVSRVDQASQLLRERESQMDQMLRVMPHAVWLASLDMSEIFYISPAYESLWGQSVATLVDRPYSWMDRIHPEDRPRVVAALQSRPLTSGLADEVDLEYRVVRDDGSVRWLYTRTLLIRDDQDRPYRLCGTAEDITPRKQAEEALAKVERALRVVSSSDQAMVRATDEKKLLESICQIIVREGGYRIALVGYARHDPEKTVEIVAREGVPDRLVSQLKVVWSDTTYGRGPTGKAIRTGQYHVVQDVRTDPDFTPWREIAIQEGSAASISLPLRSNEHTFGALTIITARAEVLTPQEIDLLKQLADDLSFGITALRARQERKHLLEEIERHAKLMDEVMEAMPEPVQVLDREGRIIYASERVSQYLEKKATEIIGRTWREVNDDVGVVEQMDADRKKVMETGEVVRGALTLRWREDVRYFDYMLAPIRTMNRHVSYVLVVAHDLTERREMEEALRDSEERYRGLIESQTDMVVRVDQEGRFTYVNDAYCQTFGKTREELLGRTFTPLVHPDDLPHTLAEMEKLKKPPYRATMEQRAMTPRGWRWISWEDYAIRDDAGQMVEIQAVGRDITDRKEAEQALQESEARFRAIYEHSALGIGIVDSEKRVVSVNAAFRKMLGYENERHYVGRSFADFTLKEDVPHNQQLYEDLLAGRSATASMQKRYVKRNGELLWANLTLSLVRDANGQPVFFVAMVEDISERKRNEEQIQQYQQQLRKMTSDLLLAEQHQRRQLAVELHDSIGQILAMAKMRLGVSIKNVQQDEPIYPTLEYIQEALAQAITYTRTLTFELSPPMLYELGLQAAVEWLVERFQQLHDVVIDLDVRGLEKTMSVERRVLMFQAIRELLMNVIKHGEAEWARVTLEHQGDQVIASVEDDGKGFIASQAQVPSESGGFGLFSIRERLTLLDGSMSVESTPGQGSHITLMLGTE